MDRDAPLWRALEALGDSVLVGLLTLLASLPVVTAAAALSAGGAVLRERDAGGSVVVRYVDAVRQRLGMGTRLTALALTPAAVGFVDVGWALAKPLTIVSTLVLAAGVFLLLVTGGVTSVACALLMTSARSARPTRTLQLVRVAGTHAAAQPMRALVPPALAVAGAAIVLLVPVALPLAPLLTAVVARSLSCAQPRPGPGPTASSRLAASAGA